MQGQNKKPKRIKEKRIKKHHRTDETNKKQKANSRFKRKNQ